MTSSTHKALLMSFQGHRPVGGDCKGDGRCDPRDGAPEFQGHRPVGGDCKCTGKSCMSILRMFQGHRPVGGDCKATL